MKRHTFVASESMFEEKKGGSRQAIWYNMHPIAQMSAFSPYSIPRTTSGLEKGIKVKYLGMSNSHQVYEITGLTCSFYIQILNFGCFYLR